MKPLLGAQEVIADIRPDVGSVGIRGLGPVATLGDVDRDGFDDMLTAFPIYSGPFQLTWVEAVS